MISVEPRVARRWFILTVVLFLLLAALYAWVIPLFEGYDEAAHFRYVSFLSTELRLPVLDEETLAHSYELITQPPLYYIAAAIATLPLDMASSETLSRISQNPYHGKLSARQSVSLPGQPWAASLPVRVARLVSLMGALATLLITWAWVRVLFPPLPTLALAATGLVAFNPVFLFLSATVTNDSWAAAGCALAVFAATVAASRVPLLPRRWFWVGASLGLALLIKYSGALATLPMAILFVVYARRAGAAGTLRAALFGAAGLLLVAGAWYMRNLWLYGAVVPLDQMARVMPTMLRPEPYDLQRTLEHVPWLVASYWGVFVANLASAGFFQIVRIFLWGGLLGVGLAGVRNFGQDYRNKGLALTVAGTWFAAAALSVLHWTRTVDYGEQGRLAHIGAPALALLLILGWQGWMPVRWHRQTQLFVGLFALLLGASQLVTLFQSYRIPAALPESVRYDREIQVEFEGGMKLLGIELPEGAALEAGRPLPVVFYFSTDRIIDQFYTLFIHVANADDQLLYQFDGLPAQGRHVSRQWRPGQVFADEYDIQVDTVDWDGLAYLSLGFYPMDEETERQVAYDADGHPIGDRVVVAKLRLHASPEATPAEDRPPEAVWERGIELMSAKVLEDDAGRPLGAELHWRAEQTLHEDLTVFVQVLDEEGEIVAQSDRQPQGGAYPTSTWRAGDVIVDEIRWPAPPSEWSRIIVGWYAVAGRRLPLAGDPAQDWWPLSVNRH